MQSRLNSTIRNIRQACEKIDNSWKKANGDYWAFSEIAYEHTEGLDLGVFADASVMHEAMSDENIAKLQAPASFSDLYYVLFRNEGFYVEVLNWWGSDINIHNHDFAGVQIQVLGTSLNVVYDFNETYCEDGVAVGDTSINKAEIWEQGARSLVVPDMPHNVSHLCEPTVSILFRTHPGKKYGPQRNFFPPNIAATYYSHDVIWRKNTKMLRLLATADDKRPFEKAFRELFRKQSFNQNLFTLVKLVDLVFSTDLVHLVYEYAQSSDMAGKIVEAVSYFKANDILAKRLKYQCCENYSETVCMSALSSVTDTESFNKINTNIKASHPDMDLWLTLKNMESRLQSKDADVLDSLTDLFGLKRSNDNEMAISVA